MNVDVFFPTVVEIGPAAVIMRRVPGGYRRYFMGFFMHWIVFMVHLMFLVLFQCGLLSLVYFSIIFPLEKKNMK